MFSYLVSLPNSLSDDSVLEDYFSRYFSQFIKEGYHYCTTPLFTKKDLYNYYLTSAKKLIKDGYLEDSNTSSFLSRYILNFKTIVLYHYDTSFTKNVQLVDLDFPVPLSFKSVVDPLGSIACTPKGSLSYREDSLYNFLLIGKKKPSYPSVLRSIFKVTKKSIFYDQCLELADSLLAHLVELDWSYLSFHSPVSDLSLLSSVVGMQGNGFSLYGLKPNLIPSNPLQDYWSDFYLPESVYSKYGPYTIIYKLKEGWVSYES